MKKNTQIILLIIKEYLNENLEQRFTQALVNLGINEFADVNNPAPKGHLLRDNYHDTDNVVLERMEKRQAK